MKVVITEQWAFASSLKSKGLKGVKFATVSYSASQNIDMASTG
jgi:hypothetical protein